MNDVNVKRKKVKNIHKNQMKEKNYEYFITFFFTKNVCM